MRKVKVAATQMSCSGDIDENIRNAEVLVREAAAQGAQIILLQELFETPYFCQKEKSDYYAYATELEQNKAVNHFKAVAKELQVVLPISFYEKRIMRATTRWRLLMPTVQCWANTARAIFRTGRAMKRSFISTPVTQASRSGIPAMPKSA